MSELPSDYLTVVMLDHEKKVVYLQRKGPLALPLKLNVKSQEIFEMYKLGEEKKFVCLDPEQTEGDLS